MTSTKKIQLTELEQPSIPLPTILPILPDEEYVKRLALLRSKMQSRALDAVIIYGDCEHFGNFLYLAGFEPRFEEGLLVVHKEGPTYVLLGNECYPMYKNMKIETSPILCQQFSLPNQTMDSRKTMSEILKEARLCEHMRIGIIGWKLFTTECGENTEKMFCVPSFITNSAAEAAGGYDYLVNATDLMISPSEGLRMINSADAIAVYEYGAAFASQSVFNVMNSADVGYTELELAATHVTQGLPATCHPMVTIGESVFKGLVSPSSHTAKMGDPISTCVGLRGGLTSRGGYIAHYESDLAPDLRNFVELLAIPYYTAAVAWYETIGLGVTGGELYDLVQSIIPREKYGWVLNPGHAIAEEEWLCSPVYPKSSVAFKSGMMMQMDIIPSMKGFVSPGCEDGVCLADENLRNEIKTKYPELWERIGMRRDYMQETLGIQLKPEVLPLSNLAAYYRPYLLNKKIGFRVER